MKCKYFTVEELNVVDKAELQITAEFFKSFIVTEGCGEIKNEDYVTKINKGDSIFIPAQSNSFEILGNCKLIISYI